MSKVFLRCPVMGVSLGSHYFNRVEFLSEWVGVAWAGEVVKWKFLSASRDLWLFSFGVDGSVVLCEAIAERVGRDGGLSSSLFSLDAVLNWFWVADGFLDAGLLDAAWVGFVESGGLGGVTLDVERPRSLVDLVSVLSVVWRNPGSLSILGVGLSVEDLVVVLSCEGVGESVWLWVWELLGSLSEVPVGVSFDGVCSGAFACLAVSDVWGFASVEVREFLFRLVIVGLGDWELLVGLVVDRVGGVFDVSGACLASGDPLRSVLVCGGLLWEVGGVFHLCECLSVVMGSVGFGKILSDLFVDGVSDGSLDVLVESVYAVGVSFGYSADVQAVE